MTIPKHFINIVIEAGYVKGVKFNPPFFIYSLHIAYEHQGQSRLI